MEQQKENPFQIIAESLSELSARILKAKERIDPIEACLNRQNHINTTTLGAIETVDKKCQLLFRCVELLSKAILGADEPDGPELSEAARREIEELRRMFNQSGAAAASAE